MNKDNYILIGDKKYKSWLDIPTSIFECAADNKGRLRTFRQILFTLFGVSHDWYFIDKERSTAEKKEWISGHSNDLETIFDIRAGKLTEVEKIALKQTIQCFTPSACFECKKKLEERILYHIPLLQLDFDPPAFKKYSKDEAKRGLMDLPYTCYVGESVSGKGLFALLLIAEPEKIEQYAEHCFILFENMGLPPDVSKGRNYKDLRFVSWDKNSKYREDPEPLKIQRFYTRPKPEVKPATPLHGYSTTDGLIKWAVKQVSEAQTGQRFETVRKVSFTMGGHGVGLDEIKQAIATSPQYTGVESKYLTHADECFVDGSKKPIIHEPA